MRTGAEPEPFKLAVGIADHCVATQLFLSQIVVKENVLSRLFVFQKSPTFGARQQANYNKSFWLRGESNLKHFRINFTKFY